MTTTNTLSFVSADSRGVHVTAWKTDRRHPITGDIIPEDHTITWPVLRAAARQDDDSLRAVYAPIYDLARAACPGEDVTGWRLDFDGDFAMSLARFVADDVYTTREGAVRVAEEMRDRMRALPGVRGSWSVDVKPIRSGDAALDAGPSVNDRAMAAAQYEIYSKR